MAASTRINLAQVLTLWAAVVAERLGFARDEALTLGRALAGLTAHAKGVRLGIFEPAAPETVREQRDRLAANERLSVRLMGRALEVARPPEGLRTLANDRPVSPAGVERCLAGKFGGALEDVRKTMEELAAALPPAELARHAFVLYERFRPAVPSGERGWGVQGMLDPERIRTARDGST